MVEVKNRNKQTTSLEAMGYLSKSNEESASVNVEDTGSIAAKIQDSQFLEGKLVLMGDDWKPLKPMKADGQASAMDHFPCLSHKFGTHNTTNKVDTASTINTLSNNGEDGLVNVIKSDNLNTERLNGEPNKRVVPNSKMESMLENGPWLIHNVPLILRKWYRLGNVAKEDLQSVPVWLKLHDVPIMAFTKDGLSVIAIKLGTPLMLDTYTTSMCMESWVWSSFVKEIIDIHAAVKLKDTLDVSMPRIESRSSGKKIMQSNPFDVLNVFDKDIGVTSSDLVYSKGDDTNILNNKDVNLDNE
nr:hypothetical protein [Tanacetum cinerariifolium]GEY58880.1 hypothetical protein [Tanacetum cinerariifolium]